MTGPTTQPAERSRIRRFAATFAWCFTAGLVLQPAFDLLRSDGTTGAVALITQNYEAYLLKALLLSAIFAGGQLLTRRDAR